MNPLMLRRVFFSVAALSLAAITLAADGDTKTSGDKQAAGETKAGETKTVKIESIELKVPADWKQQQPSNQLRLAQFDIPAAAGDQQPTEMVVSYFGGGGGGVDANLMRWVGQFENEGRRAKFTKGNSPQGMYYFVDISGTYQMPIGPPILRKTEPLPNARMLGVIIDVKDQGSYFLKMAGPETTVAKQVDAMRASFGGDAGSEQPYEMK